MGVKEKEIADLTIQLHKAKEKKTANIFLVVVMAVAGILFFFAPMLYTSNYTSQTNEELLERWEKVNELGGIEVNIASQIQSGAMIGLMMGMFSVLLVWCAVGLYQKDFNKYNERVFELQVKYNELIK